VRERCEGLINGKTSGTQPHGKFYIGGPTATPIDRPQDHRDTYGGAALHGGGAFSGKDPTKVDRRPPYAARYVAKNVVAVRPRRPLTLQLRLRIGVARPLSIYIDTHGTGRYRRTSSRRWWPKR